VKIKNECNYETTNQSIEIDIELHL